jgi:hypothetical protein
VLEPRWMADDGTHGSRMFETDDAAMTAAEAVERVAMVTGLRRGRSNGHGSDVLLGTLSRWADGSVTWSVPDGNGTSVTILREGRPS